jgi:hypothetical protein
MVRGKHRQRRACGLALNRARLFSGARGARGARGGRAGEPGADGDHCWQGRGWLAVGRDLQPHGFYQATFLNGIAWNLLNMSIAFWLLLGRIRPQRAAA